MTILFISKNGSSLGLVERVKKEGHNAYLYLLDKDSKKTGDGMVSKPSFDGQIMKESGYVIATATDKLLKETDPDLVVFDMVKMGRVADYIRGRGIAVLGGCRWADNAELDRGYGYKLMKQVGITVPSTTEFGPGEYEQAISFVKKTKKRYVYKPSGNIDTSHTYVAGGVDDMVGMLKMWRTDSCEFELQEFVEGVEVSCELWWNGLSASIQNITFEEKKFMNGDIGPVVGCAGNVVKMISDKARVVTEGIGKMERLLKKTNYRGPIDLNSIVTSSKLYGLEFTVRFGYDALQSLFELYRGSVTKLLWSIARGTPMKGDFGADYSIAVRLSIPPYPNNIPKDMIIKDIPVIGVRRESEKHIWWGDVYKDGNEYKCAGVAGDLLAATARGRDIVECRKRVYRTIDNLIVPQKQYRTDIGERVGRDENNIKRWGWF